MKSALQLFRVVCGACGHEYERWLVQSVDEVGGLISPSNRLAILKYLDQPFQESGEIFYRQRGDLRKNSRRNADDYVTIFGEICDPAPDGTRYALDRYGSCPICGNFDQQKGAPVVPYRFREADVPEATFDHWNSLKPSEREALVMQLSGSGTEREWGQKE